MVKPFTSNYKDFSRVSKPCRLEGSVDDLIVEGEIPPELDGTFSRVSSFYLVHVYIELSVAECHSRVWSPSETFVFGLVSRPQRLIINPFEFVC